MFSAATLRGAFAASHSAKYTILEEIGSGKYGYTFRCRELETDRDVCIKLFRYPSNRIRDRRNLLINAKLSHKGLARALTTETFRTKDDVTHIAEVFEYVPGLTLSTFLSQWSGHSKFDRDGHLNGVLNGLFHPLCRTVSYCHAQGFGHGDLNARNVILYGATTTDYLGNLFPVIIDFANGVPDTDEVAEPNRMANDIDYLRWTLTSIINGTSGSDYLAEPISQARGITGMCVTVMIMQNTLYSIRKFPMNVDQEYLEYQLERVRMIQELEPALSSTLRRRLEEYADEIGVRDEFVLASESVFGESQEGEIGPAPDDARQKFIVGRLSSLATVLVALVTASNVDMYITGMLASCGVAIICVQRMCALPTNLSDNPGQQMLYIATLIFSGSLATNYFRVW